MHVVGVRRRGSQDAALASDRWHIGSCTKTFTAALWAWFVRVFLLGGSDLLSEVTVDHVLSTPYGGKHGMAMGWRGIGSLPGVGYAMQGSNTMWSATALIDDQRRRAALVACNDGRSRVLNNSARLAASLLTDAP